jgi:hypothetical protein
MARIAGLIAIAVLPVAAGIDAGPGQPLGPGFSTAMIIAAGMCVIGGLIAAATISTGTAVAHNVLPGINHACQPACTVGGSGARDAA